MFVIVPSSTANTFGSLHIPEVRYHQSISPRGEYLAALAQARSAEAEYLAALAREQYLQKQREDELRYRSEAIRNHLFLDVLYSGSPAPSPLRRQDPYSWYGTIYDRQPVNPFGRDAIGIRHAIDLGLGAVRRQRQEQFDEENRELEKSRARVADIIRQLEQAVRLKAEASNHSLSCQCGGSAAAVAPRTCDPMVNNFCFSPIKLSSDPEFKVKPGLRFSRVCRNPCRGRSLEEEWQKYQQVAQRACGGVPQEYKSQEVHCCRSCSSPPTFSHCYYNFQNRGTKSCETQCHRPSVASHVQQPEVTPNSSCATAPTLKDKIEARLRNESDPEVNDVLLGIYSSLSAPAKLERKERVQKKAKDAAEASTAVPTAGLSLKEHLEARLQKDPSVELHDTIQAMFASLLTSRNSSTPAPATKDTKPAASPTAADSKGKGKQVSFELPTSSETTTTPTVRDVTDSKNTIHNIESTFKSLAAEFSFPTRLEFSPPASPSASDFHSSDTLSTTSSELAFTSTNAPVRNYEQALSALLSQLDAVESWGNEDVRRLRKELVGKVEEALEEVEREVQMRLVQYRARNVANGETSVQVQVGDAVKMDKSAPETTRVESNASVEESRMDSSPADSADVIDAEVQDSRELVDTDVTAASASTEENVLVESQDTITANSVTVSTPATELSPVVTSHDSQNSGSPTDLLASAEKEVEVSEARSPYPPSSKTSALSELVIPVSATSQLEVVEQLADPKLEPESCTSSPQTAGEESEPVDTFLLPFESPVPSKRPAATDDEVIVVDEKEDGEGSDGDNWSEVEA